MVVFESDLVGRLLLACPKKGRIHEQSVNILKKIGLKWYRSHRTDIALCTNMNIAIVFLSASDIALYVGEGRVDIGITGQDMVAEKGVTVDELVLLGFGKCNLCVQTPVKENIKDVSAVAGKRIVTSFPHLAQKYFEELDGDRKDKTTIRYVSGSVEAACSLGLADAIVDLVETGETMRAAGLEDIKTIMVTESVLVGNPHSDHKDLIATLKQRVEGVIRANQFVLIEYNVKRDNLQIALEITPGHTSATVMPLDNKEYVAVKSMIPRKDHNSKMDDLIKKAGAKDILVSTFENCRL